MKKYLLLVAVFLGLTAVAQEELNAYKYIIIPSKFDFQKEVNEHGVNLLLKYKFQQLGFESYLDTDDLPQEVRTNTCLSASPVLHTKSNMFKTVVSVELFDCANKSLFKTQEGSSNSKNIKISYNEAVRKALNSFQGYKLNFTPVKGAVVVERDNQLKKSKVVKQNNEVGASKNRLSKGSFIYNDQEYQLVKQGLMLIEIKNINTNTIIGKMIPSALKKGVHHIEFNDRIGFCYYGENENMIMEFMSSDNSVQVISIPRID